VSAVPKAYADRVCPASIELGEHLAHMTDAAEIDALKTFPGHGKRCKSCAFRRGTIPNQCADTLADAIKCVMEHVPFLCHEHPAGSKPTGLCAGWAFAEHALRDKPTRKMPWEFSK
jgi:hypothetical protein